MGSGWRPKHPYLGTPRARKDVFGSLGWVGLKCTMPKKSCGFCGGAPTPHISAHYGQKSCPWIPRMGVFQMHCAEKKCVGSWMAHRTCIPVQTTGQKSCSWIPRMGVFQIHNAKKLLCGFWGCAPNTHTSVRHGPAKVFLIPRMGGFETHHTQKYCVGSEVALQTPIPLHNAGQQRCFLDT